MEGGGVMGIREIMSGIKSGSGKEPAQVAAKCTTQRKKRERDREGDISTELLDT